MNLRLVVLMSILFFALASAACADTIMPTDTSASAPGFTEFKQKLLTAIQKRDAKFVASIITPNIDFSFGGQAGASQFKKEFRIDNPKSPFWNELGRIVKLGGIYNASQKRVWYPYLFETWPEKYDGLEYGVITVPSVVLRKQPSASSPALMTLSYDIVKLVYNQKTPAGWQKITTSGRTGYVKQAEIHSPGWRRAAFEQVNGQWKLATYIAGD